MELRVVFMGSPEFALPTLQALADNYPVVGVVTQPDKPAGRGRTLKPPAIKVLAEQLNLPLMQPRRLRQPEAMEQLKAWNPNLIVVAAFGQILKSEVLELPYWGCINVHASLLPRWRGAAPIQAAILAGDAETGVSIMQMDPGIDTGPVLSQRMLPIAADDTAGTLSAKLATIGAGLLIETLSAYFSGAIAPRSQEDYQPFDDGCLSVPRAGPSSFQPTYAPMLKKEDGQLDFTEPADVLARRVRAFQPWPGTFTIWQGQPLKILRACAVAEKPAVPGERLVYQGLPALGTASGLLVLEELQPAGKKNLPGKIFLQGARTWLEQD